MHGFYVLHNDFVMYPFPEFFMLCYYWPLLTSVDQAYHFNCFENWVSYDSASSNQRLSVGFWSQKFL